MLFEKMKLEDDERVLKVVRKHWWIIATQAVSVVFFAFAPILILTLLLNLELGGQMFDYPSIKTYLLSHTAEVFYLYSTWLLFMWMMLANYWTDHYLDLWAITTRRVILVDQRGYFRRFISSFRLERLQDMNIEVNGVVATLLDFGTIEAQTAGGSNEEFVSKFMPKPRDIKALIVATADELTATQATRISTLKDQGI